MFENEIKSILSGNKKSRDMELRLKNLEYEQLKKKVYDRIHDRYNKKIKDYKKKAIKDGVPESEIKKQVRSMNSYKGKMTQKVHRIMDEVRKYNAFPYYDIVLTTKHYVIIKDMNNGWQSVSDHLEGILYDLRYQLLGRHFYYIDLDNELIQVNYTLESDRQYPTPKELINHGSIESFSDLFEDGETSG